MRIPVSRGYNQIKTVMKTSIQILRFFIFFFIATGALVAQPRKKLETIVLGIQKNGIEQDLETIYYLIELELEKTNIYSVMDKYDVEEAAREKNLDLTNCFGKRCMVEAGKALLLEKVVTANIDKLGNKIIIQMKMIDVFDGDVERQDVTEYQDLPNEIQNMILISVNKLAGLQPDEKLVEQLVNYNLPIAGSRAKLKLNGPRMGVATVIGEAAEILVAPESEGGFEMFPAMFQIGWQQEWQYLSAGDFQALIEFIPMISGLESGKFIPSITFLNGFRFGRNGWEFAIGPSFRVVKKAEGFYDNNNFMDGGAGEWYLKEEWREGYANPYSIESRVDSRGDPEISTRLVFAFGRTFRSGYLNIPVNVYVAPDKKGTQFGVSFGFNVYRRAELRN